MSELERLSAQIVDLCNAAAFDEFESETAVRVAELLTAFEASTRDRALEEAAQIAIRHIIPGHVVQAPSCEAIANRIRALRNSKGGGQ